MLYPVFEILILAALLLLVAVEVVALLNSLQIQKENKDTYIWGQREGREALERERERRKAMEALNRDILLTKNVTFQAFAISEIGITPLPSGWHGKVFPELDPTRKALSKS